MTRNNAAPILPAPGKSSAGSQKWAGKKGSRSPMNTSNPCPPTNGQDSQKNLSAEAKSNMQHAKIYDDLTSKRTKLAVIGLGYVGLPVALEFARKISVIGFDINSRRIEMMRNHIDPSKEVAPEDFQGCD